jgi:hypothetical protein
VMEKSDDARCVSPVIRALPDSAAPPYPAG